MVQSESSPRIIDADGHVDPAGVLQWSREIGGDLGREVQKRATRWYHQTASGSSTRRGAWDPLARLRDMDEEGIAIAVLFGSSRNIESIAQGCMELHRPIATAFNDWLHAYCQTDPQRLKAAAWVPLVGEDDGCDEARRAVDELGAVGVVVNPCLDDRPLDDPSYRDLLATVEQLDVPLLVHGTGFIGDFLDKRYEAFQRRHALTFPVSLMMATMDLVLGGILEDFPALRIGLFEGGVGWLPWWIDRLDEHYELQAFAAPRIDVRPSELVCRYVGQGRLFWSCESEEQGLPGVVEQLGASSVLFASDYPHWDCQFPGASQQLLDRKDLEAFDKAAILGKNAERLYKL